MDVNFFTTFGKRPNSTKIPIGHQITVKSCTLKDQCSIESPILILRDELNFRPWQFTYCYIPLWGKYYYCAEPIWNIGTWEISCTCDVLASNRGQIFNTYQYVTRCSAEENEYISDMLYPATTETRVYSTKIATPWRGSGTAGCYVMGIISGDTALSVGSTKYWVLSNTSFRTLMTYLLSDTFAEMVVGLDPTTQVTTADFTAQTAKSILNPIQYISSCKWFPFDYDDMPGTAAVLQKLGWWNIVASGVAGKIINPDNAVVIRSLSGNFPLHPQYLERGQYMNFSPWTKYHIDFYPFDRIIIDKSWFITRVIPSGETEPTTVYGIQMMLRVDLISGMGFLEVQNVYTGDPGQNPVYVRTTAQVAVDVALAQESSNVVSSAMQASTGIIGGIVNALTGNVFMGISQGVSGIYNAAESLAPQIQTSNVNGGMTGYDQPVVLSACCIIPVDEKPDINGRPLCAWRLLGSYIAGTDPDPVFVQCANVQMSTILHQSERDQVIAELERGVYLE